MRPKTIKSKSELVFVNNILLSFYSLRPDYYALMDREQKYYDEYAHTVKKYIATKSPSILDLGSGSHRIPITLSEIITNYNNIDSLDYYSDEKLLEFTQRINSNRIKLHSYDGKEFPFINEKYDVVTSLCVFEHLTDAEQTLSEIKRVLKPRGRVLISSPNWSGLNTIIRAIAEKIIKKDRYWRYESFKDIYFGFFRIFIWYFSILFFLKPKFIYIQPRIKDGKIDFERSDDDAVHLCCPLSFKKWFKKNGFRIIRYNRFNGNSKIAKLFNTIFPSFATTNLIIAEKVD